VRCRSAGFFAQLRTVDSGKCTNRESGWSLHTLLAQEHRRDVPPKSATRKRPAAFGRVGRCDPTNQYVTVSHGNAVGSQPGSLCHRHERTIAAPLDDACETRSQPMSPVPGA
jgi:hypothetical protein